MSFFNRRRNGFNESPVPDQSDNFGGLTGYVEKTVIPTDNFADAQARAATTTAVVDMPLGATDMQQQTGERPMVFLSKEHSGIYIYEYSDRLEYYVRTNTCMYKFDTVYKR